MSKNRLSFANCTSLCTSKFLSNTSYLTSSSPMLKNCLPFLSCLCSKQSMTGAHHGRSQALELLVPGYRLSLELGSLHTELGALDSDLVQCFRCYE